MWYADADLFFLISDIFSEKYEKFEYKKQILMICKKT